MNLILGDNGEGKTNLLEAIYLLGRGRSFRALREREMIRWEKEGYYIRGVVSSRDGERCLEIKSKRGGKEAFLDGDRLHTLSELGRYFNLVLFIPEDLQLVKGGPNVRRDFLDEEIIQIHRLYEEQLDRYKKILQERNMYLKSERRDKDLGSVLEEGLISYGSAIIMKRIQVIERLNPLARLMNRRLSERKEELALTYRSSLKVTRDSDREEIEDLFREKMEEKRREEVFRRTTLVGPHRDDMEVKANKMNLREYGSQGQQRTASLALRLAQIELFKSERGEYPLILLDDVFSELDQKRCRRVGEILQEKIQSFITSTSAEGLMLGDEAARIFMMNRGSIKEGA